MVEVTFSTVYDDPSWCTWSHSWCDIMYCASYLHQHITLFQTCC